MFEGVPEGELSGNPDAIEWMREQAMEMTPEDLEIAGSAGYGILSDGRSRRRTTLQQQRRGRHPAAQ